MRTSRRTEVPIHRDRFALIVDNDRTRIVVHELDLTMELHHGNHDVARVLWQLLNANVVSVTAERVDWPNRNEEPVPIARVHDVEPLASRFHHLKSADPTLADLVAFVNQTFQSSTLSWEAKYNMIFSDHVSKRIFELLPFDYYDPDMDYQDDVTAFVQALNAHVKRANHD